MYEKIATVITTVMFACSKQTSVWTSAFLMSSCGR